MIGKAGYSTAPTYANMLMPLIEAARDISKIGRIK
jgi:flagellum-specific peptidoglycan hydrolase FlgJ